MVSLDAKPRSKNDSQNVDLTRCWPSALIKQEADNNYD